MRRLIMAAVLLAVTCISVSAQDRPIQKYISEITATAPMATAQLGVKAVGMDGRVIVDWNSGRMMVPASNVKLITTGTALAVLGADARMETTLAYSGTVENGVLKGDLFIIGGGDPTLGSGDAISPSAQALFSSWRKALSDEGISSVEGDIVGDGRWFDGPMEHPSWLYEDIGTYYGAGMDALSWQRNIQEFRVSAGAKPGDALAQITPTSPKAPWMNFTYDCSTGTAGSGDKLYLYTTDLAPVARMRGTFAVDRKPKTVQCSNKFGAYTLAYLFRENLIASGMKVGGKAADIDFSGKVRTDLSSEGSRKAPSAQSLKTFHIHKSPSLSQIVYLTNQRSDNFYAETLLRFMSKIKKGSADYEVCPKALEEGLKSLGVSTSGRLNLVDGSGLSRKDAVSPEFFCDFLRAILGSDAREAFAGSLTRPGTGSQAGRMRAEDQGAAARIYYKSGSMDGVRCYSGYVVPRDGGKEDIIVFSIMVNNFDPSLQWKVMSQIDRMMALIAQEN